MSIYELLALHKIVYDKYSPVNPTRGHPCVKYMDPVIDMRYGTIIGVNMRSFGGSSTHFHVMNESRDLKESLFDRIKTWLETPRNTDEQQQPQSA